jgi:glycosyltransferase involved in cell wall biosynthesis
MKILLIAPQPFYEKRGTPLAVALLAKALGELGHEIDLVTYHLGEPWPIPSVTHHRAAKIPFMRSVKKGLSFSKLFLDIFVCAKAFRLSRKVRYDCIHGVEEGVMMGIVLKKLSGTPLIYDMDSSIPEQIGDSRSPLWTLPLLVALAERLERWSVHNSDLVIAVCNTLKERVLSLEPGKNVAVLEDIPVVEKAPVNLTSEICRLRSELKLEDRPCVVYTGTFEAYQGIDLLLDCIPLVTAQQPETLFILVGGLPDQLERVSRQSEIRGISASILILGRRPLEEMPAFMALAKVLVSPRILGSNTPMKLYAYLQSGRPVVATRLPTHTQILDERVALLADPVPDCFAAAIVQLLQDNRLGEQIGTAAADLIESQFTYNVFKEKLKNAYSRISQC